MLRIGGKISPLSGDPLDLQVTVKALHHDLVHDRPVQHAHQPWASPRWSKPTASQILLCSLRNQAMGTDLFTRARCATSRARRSSSSSRRSTSTPRFRKVAKHVIYVDAPGAVARDLNTLPYRKVRRPLWPLKAAAR